MLGIAVDCDTHLILAMQTERGPKPDILLFPALLKEASTNVDIDLLLADAAFDAEWVHSECHETHGITSIIPPTRGSHFGSQPKGKYRRKLKRKFPKKVFGQRWQVETTFSMMKRVHSSVLRARQYHSQNRELALRVLVHNIAIIWRT